MADITEIELARRAHERDYEEQARMFQSVMSMAALAVRTTALVSGGAVVVSLAFAGRLYGSRPELALNLLWVVGIFGVSAVFSSIAAGSGYITQSYYARASYEKVHQWKHPYVLQKPEFHALSRKGLAWHRVTIFLFVVANVLLLAGIAAICLMLATEQLPASPTSAPKP